MHVGASKTNYNIKVQILFLVGGERWPYGVSRV